MIRSVRLSLALVLVLALSVVSCSHAPLRPGSSDTLDSYASGVLEQTARTIEKLKVECPSGPTSPCPQTRKDAINKGIDVYAQARKVYLPYHAAILDGKTASQAALITAIGELNAAIMKGLIR